MKMGLDLSNKSHCKIRKIVYSFPHQNLLHGAVGHGGLLVWKHSLSLGNFLYICAHTLLLLLLGKRSSSSVLLCSNSSLLNKQRSIRAAAVVRLELRWYGRRRVYLTEAVVRVEPRPQPRGCRSTTTHFYFYTTYIDIGFALLVLLLLSRQRQCSSLIVALVHVMRTSSATKKRP